MGNLTFKGQTDEKLVIKLPSRIVYAKWRGGATAAGGVIMIEVLTQWVSNNSDIKIIVKDLEGKKIETFEGKVWNNLYRRNYIPEPNKTDGLFFEVEMKAHGLSATSNEMQIFPTVIIENLKFLNAEDNKELEVISTQESFVLEADVKGPPDGSKANITLYCTPSKGETRLLMTTRVELKNRKATATCTNMFPKSEVSVYTKSDLKKDGEEYFNPIYQFTVECYATTVASKEVPYKSWATWNCGIPGGTVTVVLPDGTEKSVKADSEGVVSVEEPAVGRVTIKSVSAP